MPLNGRQIPLSTSHANALSRLKIDVTPLLTMVGFDVDELRIIVDYESSEALDDKS